MLLQLGDTRGVGYLWQAVLQSVKAKLGLIDYSVCISVQLHLKDNVLRGSSWRNMLVLLMDARAADESSKERSYSRLYEDLWRRPS